jgi:hypothetical protein
MTLSFKLILLHQLLFQGMFLAKNLYLRRKLGMAVRGGNREANMAVAFFVLFIGLSLWLAWRAPGPGTLNLISAEASLGFGLALMAASLVVALASLLGLRDSWRAAHRAGPGWYLPVQSQPLFSLLPAVVCRLYGIAAQPAAGPVLGAGNFPGSRHGGEGGALPAGGSRRSLSRVLPTGTPLPAALTLIASGDALH